MSERANQPELVRNDLLITDLVRLQDRSANLAAGWLQGGWSDSELPDMMTSGLVPIVLECVENVNRLASDTPDWFKHDWAIVRASAMRLEHASEASSTAIQPVLLLLPLTIDSLLNEAIGSDLEANKVKTVAPAFIATITKKAESIGEKCCGDLRDLIKALDIRSSRLVT